MQAEAARQGIPHDWMEAARRSPVYALAVRHKVALPLHPEYRTLPMVWYIPPLSPVADIVHAAGYDDADPDQVFATIDSLRIPIEYLANLFTAGDVEPVRRVLRKLAAIRATMRAEQLGLVPNEELAAAVDASSTELDDLYRLLAIAKYDDRYVIPMAHAEDAGRLMGQHEQMFCSLDTEGGPGMGGAGPPGSRSRHPAGQPGGARRSGPTTGATHFNLLGWDGAGNAPHLFPETEDGEAREPRSALQAGVGAVAVPDRGACSTGLDDARRRRRRRDPRRPAGRRSRQFLAWLRATPPTEVAQHYVETFDLRRRCALYLTYYRYGDTRKRGMAMLTFKTAYRDGSVRALRGRAARLPAAGARVRLAVRRGASVCCAARRADLELLRRALHEAETPYAIDRRRRLRPAAEARRAETGRVSAAWEAGPPREDVGLEPFAPPEYLGMAPRGGAVTRGDTCAEVFWWVALPYLALAIFVVGHIWRWRYDQFGWTSRSTQLQERRCSSGGRRSSTTRRSPPSAGTSSAS